MSNDPKTTERITIWGIVQGVGFRPFVTRLADKMNINGYIKNMGGFVQLTVTDPEEKIGDFVRAIRQDKPSASEIVRVQREKIDYQDIKGFSIGDSEVRDDDIGMIPADIAICDDCIEEFYDPNNPRYKHPYISCTVCGPRYTIIDSLPYDRDNTTMDEFPMCGFCEEQYNDSLSKRYHSQTISCHDCGPMAEYISQNGEHIIVHPHDKANRENAVKAAIKDIRDGKVIALKGTGGYYFVCSPFIEDAVNTLREVKIREEKPFAVMFKDTESIRSYCIMGNEEESLIKSGKRPIVLLERRPKSYGPEIVHGVCRSSRYIGAFLPSLGLQYQIIEETGPLIMTSANLSDLPIIFRDDEMLALLNQQPDLAGVLLNRRKIRMSLDDSVARVIDSKPQLTRRSKGYAPIPIHVSIGANGSERVANSSSCELEKNMDKTHMIFAAGGQLKSAFSLSKGDFAYISQYFGDLDSMESQNIYENNFHRMKKFFGIEPGLVICDMHPLYYTSRLAEEYVENENKFTMQGDKQKIQLLKVQHHHAHTASVMAECGIEGPVIGVSFDGTGYGTDGNIWGGEFLICEQDRFERFSHLKYVDMIGGDSSMKEGWKSAVSHRLANMTSMKHKAAIDTKKTSGTNGNNISRVLDISEIIDYSIREKTLNDFADIPVVETAINSRINTVKTSSMGRLFDAVSSLLGIHHINRYEGECAIMLENAAYYSTRHPGQNEAWDLALKFHKDVADFILTECIKVKEDRDIRKVALSGGVFQNKILIELTLELLRKKGFDVYYNSAVPPNDGGIALGQNFIGMYHIIQQNL